MQQAQKQLQRGTPRTLLKTEHWFETSAEARRRRRANRSWITKHSSILHFPLWKKEQKNWGSIPEMQVCHLCYCEFTGGNNTTNRVESYNAKIKNVLSSSSKLHETLFGLSKIWSCMVQGPCHKAIVLKTYDFYSYLASEDVEKQHAKVSIPYTCRLVSEDRKNQTWG